MYIPFYELREIIFLSLHYFINRKDILKFFWRQYCVLICGLGKRAGFYYLDAAIQTFTDSVDYTIILLLKVLSQIRFDLITCVITHTQVKILIKLTNLLMIRLRVSQILEVIDFVLKACEHFSIYNLVIKSSSALRLSSYRVTKQIQF